jgi:hypothetical protein
VAEELPQRYAGWHHRPEGDDPGLAFDPQAGFGPVPHRRGGTMDQLDAAAGAQADDMTWAAVERHIREAVLHTLRDWPAGLDQWRKASPDEIAEAVTVFAMAAIHPVLTGEQVGNGVRMMRAVLGQAGIDPAGLPWNEVPSQ